MTVISDGSHSLSLGMQLLEEGRALLERGDRTAAAQVLSRARDERDVVLAAHALIEDHELVGSFTNVMGLNCTISTEDDIFGFFKNHHSCRNPLRDYLADGWRTLSELMLLLEAVDQPLLHTPQVLEFARSNGLAFWGWTDPKDYNADAVLGHLAQVDGVVQAGLPHVAIVAWLGAHV